MSTCPLTTRKMSKPPCRNTGLGPDDVDLLVATDSEGILGIGDQGVGGIEISIGKLAVYTAAAGIHPRRVLPVVLDMGTDNLKLLNDDLYLGARHARVRDQRYDDLIDAYVTAVSKLFPERDAALGGLRRHQRPPHPEQVRRPGLHLQRRHAGHRGDGDGRGVLRGPRRRNPDQRPAGRHLRCGHRRAWHRGHDARPDDPRRTHPARRRPAGSTRWAARACWSTTRPVCWTSSSPTPGAGPRSPAGRPADRGIGLAEVVSRVHPTMLIGTSTHSGAFTEAIVKDMAAHTDRPIIMPLSNPTSKCEALPADLIAWTDGRVLTATGSPFDPVTYQDRTYQIAQANNALVFPGLGLGVVVAKATRISDRMIAAAADAVARMSDASQPGAPLLPPMTDLRTVSAAVAIAVATTAAEEGLPRSNCTI